MRAWAGGWAAVWCLSCASPKADTPAPPPPPAAPLPPLPRSSIAAVLAHRDELGLTADQVQKLSDLDQKREQADAQLRSDLAAVQHGSSSSSTSGGAGAQPAAAPAGGMGGMGGRHGGGRMGRSTSPSAAPGSKADAIQQKLDDDDTQAFLQAEPIFTDAQRDHAEDIAGAYRERLFDQRQPAPK